MRIDLVRGSELPGTGTVRIGHLTQGRLAPHAVRRGRMRAVVHRAGPAHVGRGIHHHPAFSTSICRVGTHTTLASGCEPLG